MMNKMHYPNAKIYIHILEFRNRDLKFQISSICTVEVEGWEVHPEAT